jgi:hypothetical protein
MKLAKRIKRDYKNLLEQYPFPHDKKDFYVFGYEDGILAMYTAMQEMGLGSGFILNTIARIDPKGVSVAYDLAMEEYNEQSN